MLFTFTVEVLVPSVIERHRETLGMESRVWVIVSAPQYLSRFLKSPSAGLAEAQRSQREKSD